jgi:hypothetical protein
MARKWLTRLASRKIREQTSAKHFIRPATSLENIMKGPISSRKTQRLSLTGMAAGLLFNAVGLYAPACAPAVPFRRRAVRED